MPADPIITCLERLTDYHQFERLCCALLSQTGYPQIEPLGGTGDDGLDAIVPDDGQGGVIAFAFTVRKDWFPKLKSDSRRVAETHKGVKTLVYACTSSLSTVEKDKAFAHIRATHNWRLDLIDIKCLRMHLVSRRHLIDHHPSIFDPRYFPSAQSNFAQDYIRKYAELLNWLARSDENLATEIEAKYYVALRDFLVNSGQAELTCFDTEMSAALGKLHAKIWMVWEVISDEYYIPAGWRWKFDNTERSHVNVQAILRAKKVKIVPLLEQMRVALQAFSNLARH